MIDLCDDDELRRTVLSLLDEIQHKQLSDLHSGVDRQNSSLRRYLSSCLIAFLAFLCSAVLHVDDDDDDDL